MKQYFRTTVIVLSMICGVSAYGEMPLSQNKMGLLLANVEPIGSPRRDEIKIYLQQEKKLVPHQLGLIRVRVPQKGTRIRATASLNIPARNTEHPLHVYELRKYASNFTQNDDDTVSESWHAFWLNSNLGTDPEIPVKLQVEYSVSENDPADVESARTESKQVILYNPKPNDQAYLAASELDMGMMSFRALANLKIELQHRDKINLQSIVNLESDSYVLQAHLIAGICKFNELSRKFNINGPKGAYSPCWQSLEAANESAGDSPFGDIASMYYCISKAASSEYDDAESIANKLSDSSHIYKISHEARKILAELPKLSAERGDE